MILKKEVIGSRSNPLLVWATSLKEKKYREKHACFSFEGYKLFEEAVKEGASISHVFISESSSEQYLQTVLGMLSDGKYEKTEVCILSDFCYEKLTQEKSPQGIVTVVKNLDKFKNIIKIYKVEDLELEGEKAAFLCSVRDPSNLGAILRSAAAFDIRHIFMSGDCADPCSSRAVRASMGALFRLNLYRVEAFPQLITTIRESGRRVFAAELTNGAESLADRDFCSKDLVVIGNEGHGIPGEVREVCDGSVYIPIAPDTESLNAAVAASIFFWEMRGDQ